MIDRSMAKIREGRTEPAKPAFTQVADEFGLNLWRNPSRFSSRIEQAPR